MTTTKIMLDQRKTTLISTETEWIQNKGREELPEANTIQPRAKYFPDPPLDRPSRETLRELEVS